MNIVEKTLQTGSFRVKIKVVYLLWRANCIMKNIPNFFKKIIAVSFFSAVFSVAALGSYSYADNYYQIYSSNVVDNWSSVVVTNVNQLAVTSTINDKNIYLSTNHGQTWTVGGTVDLLPGSSLHSITATQDGHFIIISATDGVFLSNNGLTGPFSKTLNGPIFTHVAMDSTGSHMYAISDATLYKSDNGGGSWSSISVAEGVTLNDVDCSSDGSIVYVATATSVYKSVSYGGSFSQLTTPDWGDFRGVATSADGNIVLTGGDAMHLMVSTDGGMSWTDHSEVPLADWTAVTMSSDGQKMVASTYNGGITLSSGNSGVTWISETALPGTSITSLSLSADGMYLVGASSNAYLYTARLFLPTLSAPSLINNTDTGYSNTDFITNAGSIDVSVSCQNTNDEVHLYKNSETTYATAYCSNGTAVFPGYDISGISETSFSLAAVEWDGAMTYSSMGTSVVITVDRTVPVQVINTTNISTSTADIYIQYDAQATSTVDFGLSSSYGSTTNGGDASFAMAHTIRLSGLTPGTTYHYKVTSTDLPGNQTVSDDITFETDPAPVVESTVSGGLPSIQVIQGIIGIISNGSSLNNSSTKPDMLSEKNNSSATSSPTLTSIIIDSGARVSSKPISTGLYSQRQLFKNEDGTAFTFNKSLSLGSSGSSYNSDIKKLQVFLNSAGYMVASTGPGSIGNETNKFGPATKRALLKFQKAIGIRGANGMLGPVTRKVINQLIQSVVR